MEDGPSGLESSLHSGSVGDQSESGKSDARSQAVRAEESGSTADHGEKESVPGKERGVSEKDVSFAESKFRRGGNSSCSSTNDQVSRRTKSKKSKKLHRSVKDDAQRAVRHWTCPGKDDSMAVYRWSLSGSSDTIQQDLQSKTTDSVRIVAAVLAFQRWRQYQLKKLFHHELRKVTREVKHDDECLANLEREIATRDLHLSRAMSDMAQMRAQLSNTYRCSLADKHIDVDELQKRLAKAQQKVSETEQQLRHQNAEIQRLSSSLKMMEEETRRVDGKLRGDIATLQSEKEGALGEVRVLLDQLARRDEEVASQSQENEKLRVALIRMAERQNSQEKQMEVLRSEHVAEVKRNAEKLKETVGAKLKAEMELATCMERCDGLLRDKENLVVELARATEQADMSSRHAEELQEKINCAAETHARASENVAAEIIQHLKLLTGHMRELENTVDHGSARPGSRLSKSLESGLPLGEKIDFGNRQGRAATKSRVFPHKSIQAHGVQSQSNLEDGKLGGVNVARKGLSTSQLQSVDRRCMGTSVSLPEERQDLVSSAPLPPDRCLFESTKEEHTSEIFQPAERNGDHAGTLLTADEKQMVLFRDKDGQPVRSRRDEDPRPHESAIGLRGKDPGNAAPERERWVTWRWRWAVATARAERLFRQVCSLELLKQRLTREVAKLEQERTLESSPPGGNSFESHKLLPLVLTAWRAYTRMKKHERRAMCSQQSLDGLMAALPWWIRRVGERRRLERFFSIWHRSVLRSGKKRLADEILTAEYASATSEWAPSVLEGFNPSHWASAPGVQVHVGRKVQRIHPAQHTKNGRSLQARGSSGRLRATVSGVGPDYQQHPPGSTVTFDNGRSHDPTRQASWQALHHNEENLGTTVTARALKGLQEELRNLQGLVTNEFETLHRNNRKDEPGNARYKYTQRPPHLSDRGSCAKKSLDAIWEVCNDLARALNEAGKQLQAPEKRHRTTVSSFISPQTVRRRPASARNSAGSALRRSDTCAVAAEQESSNTRPVDCVVQISRDCNVKVEPLPAASNPPTPSSRVHSCGRTGHHHGEAAGAEPCLGSQYADLLRSEIFRLKEGYSGEEERAHSMSMPLPPLPGPGPGKKPPWCKY